MDKVKAANYEFATFDHPGHMRKEHRMETIAGKALNDVANLVSEKWYSGMGLIGLIIVMWTLLAGTPQDDILVGAIGVAMLGFGFAEAETRTFQIHVDQHMKWKLTQPTRKLTGPGLCLYLLGAIAALIAIGRAIFLSL